MNGVYPNYFFIALLLKYCSYKNCTLSSKVANINHIFSYNVYFIKNVTNCWYDEKLLVNKKIILIVSLNEN